MPDETESNQPPQSPEQKPSDAINDPTQGQARDEQEQSLAEVLVQTRKAPQQNQEGDSYHETGTIERGGPRRRSQAASSHVVCAYVPGEMP